MAGGVIGGAAALPLITLSELVRRLADPTVPESSVTPYLTVKQDRDEGHLAPTLLPNEYVINDAASSTRSQANIALGYLNQVYRGRRRRLFEERLADGGGGPVLVAEGDSWFEYPAFIDDVIDHLNKRFNVLCLSSAGDELRTMVAQPEYSEYLDMLDARGVKVRAFLFSGGGNDIVGNQLYSLLKDYNENKSPEWHFDTPEWKANFEAIASGYQSLLTAIRAKYPQLPVLVHGYDYGNPLPQQPFRLPPLDGWLGAPMRRRNIPDGPPQKQIAHAMISAFNALLIKVAAEFPRVRYVNNLNSLTGQWYDELHGTSVGFRRVAKNFITALEQEGVTP